MSTHLYIRYIVQMYGISTTIVSNKNQRFQAHFLTYTLESLGNSISFDNSYHFETNGSITRENQNLEDIFTSVC